MADSCVLLFIGPEIVAIPPVISDPSILFNLMSIPPKGITRSFTIVSKREPELNAASENSAKLKSFVTGSNSKDGILTVVSLGISDTLG